MSTTSHPFLTIFAPITSSKLLIGLGERQYPNGMSPASLLRILRFPLKQIKRQRKTILVRNGAGSARSQRPIREAQDLRKNNVAAFRNCQSLRPGERLQPFPVTRTGPFPLHTAGRISSPF